MRSARRVALVLRSAAPAAMPRMSLIALSMMMGICRCSVTRSLGIEAIVVALSDDPAVFEIEEDGEVGEHFLAGLEVADGNGHGAGPNDFERDAIAHFDLALNFVVLLREDFLAGFGALDHVRQGAAAAPRRQPIWKFFVDDVGREEPR